MSHIKTVGRIYEAFGSGDIGAILGYLAESVEWEYGAISTDVPWLQPRKGRAAVTGFFHALTSNLEIHRFDPKSLMECGNLVIAVADFEATVKATRQRIIEEDEVHIWHFDELGQVSRFRHRVDTHMHWMASAGVAAASA